MDNVQTHFLLLCSTLKPTFYYEKGGDFDFLHILRIKSPRLRLGLFIAAKCVKSQNHPPFYTIKRRTLFSKNMCVIRAKRYTGTTIIAWQAVIIVAWPSRVHRQLLVVFVNTNLT